MRRFLNFITLAFIIAIIGCHKPESVAIDYNKLKPILKEYIKTDMRNFAGISYPDGDIFIAYYVMGDEADGDTIKSYLFVHCQEYYLDRGQLAEGSGVAFPIALKIKIEQDTYKITDHEVPRDGEIFEDDVRRIIPEKYRANKAQKRDNRILSEEVMKEAKDYFKEKLN